MTEAYDANTWTAAGILAAVRRVARLNSSDADYTDAVLFDIIDQATWSLVNSAVFKARDGRQVLGLSRTLVTDAIDANDEYYLLPPRAAGETIESVYFCDPSETPTEQFELRPMSASQAIETFSSSDGVSDPSTYVIEDHTIRIYPRPTSTSYRLRITYARRRPKIVAATSCAQITSVDSNGGSLRITMSGGVPSGATTSTTVDVVGQHSPHRFLLTDLAISGATATALTTTTTYDSSVHAALVNQYATLSGQSCFVHLPLELKLALERGAAALVLEEQGKYDAAAALKQTMAVVVAEALDAMVPRVKGRRERIVNERSIFRLVADQLPKAVTE